MFLIRRAAPILTARTMSTAATAAATTASPSASGPAPTQAQPSTQNASATSPPAKTKDAVSDRIYEGVFAVNKPSGMSSAQVIRDLQAVFKPSQLFAPWFASERRRMTSEANRSSQHPKAKRKILHKAKNLEVKMGHGGTLDPDATGVLVLGIGRGTKSLQSYTTDSNKSYDTTLLFGIATDTYDLSGKVMARAAYEHVTREKVEDALGQFRGDEISQLPPIYSALKMDGKPLYEYAREGKELPREIERRTVGVKKLEITEWLEPGRHEYRWPEEEAPVEQRKQASKLLQLEEAPGVEVPDVSATAPAEPSSRETTGMKRKHDSVDETASTNAAPVPDTTTTTTTVTAQSTTTTEPPAPKRQKPTDDTTPHDDPVPSSTATSTTAPTDPTAQTPPAVRLSMTVTSGFYVRSLCHDVGRAVGSLGAMATLVRTRQGGYELGTSRVLEYGDIVGKPEGEWGSKVRDVLGRWMAEHGGDEVD